MAERKFDYQAVSEAYKNMLNITGDAGSPDSIAGILHDIDEEYHNNVGVCDEAIFGDLGSQLVLDWENTSSNFGSFVAKFDDWSALVVQSAGNYAQFENDIAGFKEKNPLGATSGGITTGQVASSSYTQSYTEEELEAMAASSKFYDLVGAYYVDTGMVEYAGKQAFWNGFGDCMSVVSIALSAFSLVKGLKVVEVGAKAGAAAAGTADDAAKLTGDVATSTIYQNGGDIAGNMDDLIARGYTLGADGTFHPPTNLTAAESMFAGTDVSTASIYQNVTDVAGNMDDLIAQGYTLGADGTFHPPTTLTAADSMFATADVSTASLYQGGGNIAASMDDLIEAGYTLGSDGVFHPPTNITKTTSAFYTPNKFQQFVSSAGNTLKNGGQAAMTFVKDAAGNLIPVAGQSVRNLGVSGVFGQVANAGQNYANGHVPNYAQTMSDAQERFGSNK